jgi:Spy/CpxP family protein refolding chaperone
MNKKYRKLKMVLMAAIAILFSGIYASADCGKEYGHHRGMHQYKGWHHGSSGGPGCGALNNLSEDDIEKLDAERKVFFEATKVLRRKIYQKRLELASELAKESPDAATAAALQTEISDFKAQMAQKRLEHILRVQKINPDLGRGFWGGGPMGPGMMEPGGEGSWGPNNCPYSDSGGNCGRGQRMKKHRGGYGMGPGCSGRDNSRQFYKGQGSQAE